MRFDFFQISVVDGGADLFTKVLTHEERNKIATNLIVSRPKGIYRNQSYLLGNLEDQKGVIWGRIIRPGEAHIGIIDEETGDVDDAKLESAFWTHFAYLTDEQVIAVVHNPEFFSGEPLGMSKLLEQLLNSNLSKESYSVRVILKSRTETFWEAVNAGTVTFLRMEFVPPNAFRSQGPLTDLLRALRTNNGAKRAGYDLSNAESGLEISETDDDIKEEVSYISKGGGRWRLKYRNPDGTSKTARSDQAAVGGHVDYNLGQIDDPSVRSNIIQWIRQVLERLL